MNRKPHLKQGAKAHGKGLETQLNDARNTMDKYLRDYDTLYQRTQKLTEGTDSAYALNLNLAPERVVTRSTPPPRRRDAATSSESLGMPRNGSRWTRVASTAE